MYDQKTRLLVRRLCGAALAVNALGFTAAMAQQADSTAPAADEPIQMEKMVVTGTRLTSAEAEESLSVTPIEPDAPINVGFPRVADLLRTRATQYGGVGIVNEGYGNGGSGASTIALRGLPSNATLLLVDGRRVAGGDLNLIPEAAIERIDILNDGAGAIYGSDAVAGVVNVILKKDFTGTQFGAYYGNTTSTDISERKFTALTGATTEKSKFVVSAEYSASNDQMSVDRERSAPSGDNVSSTSNPGTFTPRVPATNADGTRNTPLRWTLDPGYNGGQPFALTSASQIPAGFNPFAYVTSPGSSTSAERNAQRNAQEAALNALLPANSPVRYGISPSLAPGVNAGFPFGFYTIAYRPHEKYGAYFSGEHKLTDNVSFFAEGFYMRNKSHYELAPSPLGGRVLGLENYWANQVFPGFSGANGSGATGITVGYRPVELGPRVYDDDFEEFHGTAGLKGELSDARFHWEIAYTWDRWSQDERISGAVNSDTYNALLADSTPAAWNSFGYTPIGGYSVANSADTLTAVGITAMYQSEYSISAVDAQFGGDLIDLPGGTMAFTVGTEWRQEKLNDQPDYTLQSGLAFPFNTAQPTVAERQVGSMYGEVSIPLVNEEMEIPAITTFSTIVALRYEEYDDVGGTGAKPRVAFRWQPIGKEMTVRGSYAQGFIAPGFFDLYQLPAQDFQELRNPLTNDSQQPEEGVLTMGNPNLKPSDSETYLVGFMYSPEFLKGFSIGGNYYNITQTGIPFESAQYVVNEFFAAGGEDNPTNPWGATATPSGQNPLGAQVELNAQGDLYQVRNVGPINTGERFTDGIDVIVSQEIGTDWGKFTLSGQATYMLNFEQEDFPGAGTVDYLGRFWASGAALDETGFPEWRANILLSYEYSRWTAGIAWNFMQGYEEDTTQANLFAPADVRDVDNWQTLDARIGYKIPKIETELTVGCNNVLDAECPLVLSSFESNVDRSNVDLRGRMWFINVSKTF